MSSAHRIPASKRGLQSYAQVDFHKVEQNNTIRTTSKHRFPVHNNNKFIRAAGQYLFHSMKKGRLGGTAARITPTDKDPSKYIIIIVTTVTTVSMIAPRD